MFRVLYLFAGKKRKASVREYLAEYTKKHNVKLKMTALDILRGGMTWLMRGAAGGTWTR